MRCQGHQRVLRRGVEEQDLTSCENVGTPTVAVVHHIDAPPVRAVLDHVPRRDLGPIS